MFSPPLPRPYCAYSLLNYKNVGLKEITFLSLFILHPLCPGFTKAVTGDVLHMSKHSLKHICPSPETFPFTFTSRHVCGCGAAAVTQPRHESLLLYCSIPYRHVQNKGTDYITHIPVVPASVGNTSTSSSFKQCSQFSNTLLPGHMMVRTTNRT